MSLYAIGDVQGCHAELVALLERIDFRARRDRLIFVGDLVNRGPASAAVLRLVRSLGRAARCVLGNHDLHLLAVASGATHRRRHDTFDDVLAAPDRDALLDWLRRQPLLYRNAHLRTTVVHAGLPPQWTPVQARRHAREVEAVLGGPGYRALLERMYADQPRRWDPALRGWDRLRCIVNCCTRMRYCDSGGRLDLDSKGAPGSQPARYRPWYAVPGRRSAGDTIVFGHWSTLRLRPAQRRRHAVEPIDTGCVWGERLTALRLDDGTRWWVPSRQPRPASFD